MKLPNSLYYLAFALTMLFFVLVFIPRKILQKIFWFSTLWGVGLDLILILLFKKLNLYHYVNDAPLDFCGSPILINLSWACAVMLFIYFLPARKERYIIPLYLGTFALIGTFIGFFLINAGLIVETHWNELLRFPVVYLAFCAVYWHYQYLKKNDSQSI